MYYSETYIQLHAFTTQRNELSAAIGGGAKCCDFLADIRNQGGQQADLLGDLRNQGGRGPDPDF